MNLASIPLIFVGGGVGYAAQSLASLALPVGFLRFTRGFEAEADFLGVEYLYKSGYVPQALTSFFEKVKTLGKHKPGTLTKASRHIPKPRPHREDVSGDQHAIASRAGTRDTQNFRT